MAHRQLINQVVPQEGLNDLPAIDLHLFCAHGKHLTRFVERPHQRNVHIPAQLEHPIQSLLSNYSDCC